MVFYPEGKKDTSLTMDGRYGPSQFDFWNPYLEEIIIGYTGGENAAVLAVQAGNDMLTSSDFVTQYNAVLAAVQDGTIPESQIHASAVRVIDWKMQLGLISYDA